MTAGAPLCYTGGVYEKTQARIQKAVEFLAFTEKELREVGLTETLGAEAGAHTHGVRAILSALDDLNTCRQSLMETHDLLLRL